MPIVSVVIPVYNVEAYLRQCLDSVIHQTLRDLEILCVNDGSTDSSLAILNEYAAKDSRIIVFSKENEGKGAASARNCGLDRASGKYLAILDSDDYFAAQHLEKLVHSAEKHNSDIVICDAQGFDSRTGLNTYNAVCYQQADIPDKAVFSVNDYPDKIFQMSTSAAWNCLFLRSFVERYRLRFQHVIMTDDLYFSFSCRVLAERISIVNEKLIYYRMNSGTSQSDLLTKYPDSAYPAYLKLKKSLKDWDLYALVEQSLINCAANTFRGAYDRIKEFGSFEHFHNQLKGEIFRFLEIGDKSSEYFYDMRTYSWVRLVLENTASEVIFKAARGYGAPMTTGVLRFQLPESMLEKEVIPLKRGSITSTYYYVQLLFLGLDNRVQWVD